MNLNPENVVVRKGTGASDKHCCVKSMAESQDHISGDDVIYKGSIDARSSCQEQNTMSINNYSMSWF